MGRAHAVSQLQLGAIVAKACHSCTLHLGAAELRSPPSHQHARLGRTRRRSTHRYLEHRIERIWNQGQNDTNLRDRTKSQRCIRFPNQGGDIRIGGEESKAWEARIQKKPAREESGTFERRKFELRRHRPALVIFVRVRVVGTWQERFDTLFEHSMPQHNNSAPAHTWQIA